MKHFIVVLTILLCAFGVTVYAEMQQDVINRDVVGSAVNDYGLFLLPVNNGDGYQVNSPDGTKNAAWKHDGTNAVFDASSGVFSFVDQILANNEGIEFAESDSNPACAAGNYNIYADLSELKLKKCENGTTSDLDASGGGSGDITDVGTCTTGACAVEGGNDMFPFIYEGTANTFETTFSVTDPTVDNAVTFPDAAGEVSLLGQTISDAELVTDFISETELDTIAELNTQLTDATVLTKSEKFTKCAVVENLTAADDNMLLASFFNAVTITDVWCNYNGAAPTTVAQISLEDGTGNAMTHTTPVCAGPGTAATSQSVTAAGALTAREVLRFDVDNAVSPETDTYMFCVAYTID